MSERDPMKPGRNPDLPEQKDHDTLTHYDTAQELHSGSLLGPRYKIIRLLGAGGMGRVYLAHDLELDTDVAIKIIRPELGQSEKTLERLRNELLLARKVSHRNIVRIHDIGEVEGMKYLSMSYTEGPSLREVLKKDKALPWERVLEVAKQICEGVAAAHEEGIIHRDLKPANILLDDTDRVYITDFGIARSLSSPELTQTGAILGTPAYFSPEQARGEKADIRTDIYAIGLILYEMLTGELPFLTGNMESSLRKREIPKFFVVILRKCLDQDPDRRYQSAGALLLDLKNRRVAEDTRTNRLNWKHAVAAFILLALIALIVLRPEVGSRPPATQVQTPQKPDSLAVLPFVNKTGKQDLAWVETGMADLLITDLASKGNYHVISPDRVYQTLKDLKFFTRSYDADSIGKLLEILDADYLIHGNVTQAGSSLRADLSIINAQEIQNPIYLKTTGSKQEDLILMSDQLAFQIHQKLHPTTVKKSPGVKPQISIPALKAFDRGVNDLRQGDYKKSIANLEEAIRLAPKFSRAYLRLSEAYENSGDLDKAAAILSQGIQNGDPSDEKTAYLLRSEYALMQGELDQAIKMYKTLNEKYPNDSELLFPLAETYEEKGDLKNAVLVLEKLIQLDPHHPQAFFHLGKDTVLMGEAEKGISQYLIQALSIQRQLNNSYGQADVLNAMGVAYERLGRYDEAIQYYQDALTLREKIGNKKGAATSMSNLAKIYIFQGEFAKSQAVLNKILRIFEEIGDRQGIGNVTNMFGVLNEDQGKFEEALKHYKKALQIRKQVGNDRLTAQSYDNVGQIYYLTGQYDDAQVFWEQALNLRKAIGEESGVILSLQNMGFLQLTQGQLDRALKSFLESLEKSRSIQYENAIAVSLGNLGTIYQYQGRYGAALQSYQEAIDVLTKLKDKKGVAEYTKLMGSAFLDLHSLEASRKKLEAALKLAGEIDSTELTTDIQIFLSRLYRLQGALDTAQKQLEESIKHATEQNYERTLVGARIEEAWILSASNNLTGAQKAARDALRKSKALGDVWLTNSCSYASAYIHLQTGEPKQTLALVEERLPAIRKIGLKPELYRFHSLAGQAYLSMNSRQKAGEHFTEASGYFEELKKGVDQQYLSDMMQDTEAQRLQQALQSLNLAKKIP